jgi:ADP-glucose pyrophosphorylase
LHKGKIEVTTKSTRKPNPSDIFDFIQKGWSIRGGSVENHIVSMPPDTPHSRQPNQTTNTAATFFQSSQITKQQKMVPACYPCNNIFSYPIGNFIP